MAKFRLDDIEYDTDNLSADAKGRFEMLVATENRLRELRREIAILQTARHAYATALKEVLPGEAAAAPAGSR
jgi:hypothetical protein